MAREVNTVTVIGAGDMGHGVAELAALKGFTVRLRDVSQDVIDAALGKVKWSLDKLAQHQTITKDEAAAAMDRLTGTTDLAAALDGTDFVIEAVPENLELKRKVFAEVEALAPATAVLTSNTSTMRITEIAAGLQDPTRLVGMHFFNPVLLMDLIEVIPADGARPDAVATTVAVAERLGKTTVVCAKDTPGFITSRLIGVWVGAGVLAHDHGYAKKEAIDAAMKFRGGFPMGPFELTDYTGLDIGVHAGQYIASRLGAAYEPGQSLTDLVAAGKLGKKTGQGFYAWDGNRITATITADDAKGFDPALVMALTANEAAKVLAEGVATAADIDLAMRNGTAFPKGPLEWADEAGLDTVHALLQGLHEKTGHALAEPAPGLVERVTAGKLGKKTGAGFFDHAAALASDGTAAPTYNTILVDIDADTKVGVITFNRTHRLHAINGELLDDVERAFADLEARDDVRCIVLTGAGDKAFCAGADLTDTGGDFTPVYAMELARRMNWLGVKFERSAKPVVAAINGFAYGGGMEWTLACDFRLAAKRVKMGLTEATLGLIPAAGGTQRLPKLIGLAAAKEIALLGGRHTADEMKAFGVVHRVFENDAFEQEWRAFATQLAAGAPIAQSLIKRALAMGASVPTEQGLEYEGTAFGMLLGTEDAMEGVSAMFTKRKPEFQGK